MYPINQLKHGKEEEIWSVASCCQGSTAGVLEQVRQRAYSHDCIRTLFHTLLICQELVWDCLYASM